MRISENPFYILGVTPEMSVEQINEVADDKCFTDEDNESKYETARSILTNPRQRLEAEVCWFYDHPGIVTLGSFQVVKDIDDRQLQSSRETVLYSCEKIFSVIQTMPPNAIIQVVSRIITLDTHYEFAFEESEISDLYDSISYSRQKAQIPMTDDERQVKTVLQRVLEEYVRAALHDVMEGFSFDTIVAIANKIAELRIQPSVGQGKKQYHEVISIFIDLYNGKVQNTLDEKCENIERMIDAAENYTETAQLQPLFNQVKGFDRVAQPLQLYFQDLRQSGRQEQSEKVFEALYYLILYYITQKKLPQLSLAVTEFACNIFTENPEALEKLHAVRDALGLFEETVANNGDETKQNVTVGRSQEAVAENRQTSMVGVRRESIIGNRQRPVAGTKQVAIADEVVPIKVAITNLIAEVDRFITRAKGHESINYNNFMSKKEKWLATLHELAGKIFQMNAESQAQGAGFLAMAYLHLASACTWAELWDYAYVLLKEGWPYAQKLGDQSVLLNFSYSMRHYAQSSMVTENVKSCKTVAELETMKAEGGTEGNGCLLKIIGAIILIIAFIAMSNSCSSSQPTSKKHTTTNYSTTKPSSNTSTSQKQKAQNTTVNQYQTPSVNANVNKPANTPADVFQQFHKAITDRQYMKAYNFLSPEMKQYVGNVEGWKNGYATTLSSVPTNISVISFNTNRTDLRFRLRAVDRVGTGMQTRYFNGTCTLIKCADGWKIDEVHGQWE